MRIRLFGTLEVVADDGTVVPLNGAKLRTLLALLALDAGKVVAADRLIDCVYGSQLPQRADNALQLLVSKLRQVLKAGGRDAPVIVTRSPGYLLEVPADEVDVLRYPALVAEGRALLEAGEYARASSVLHQARELCRGPALAEFAFDDFALGRIVRLEELQLAASEDCFAAELELGRHLDVVGELAQFVAANPLRERPWGQYMLALYRSGRQADALRAFRDARAHLAEELGIDPGPDLRRLEAAILAQDPSLALAPSAADGDRPVVNNGRVGNVSPPLSRCLGREEELAAVPGLLEGHRLVTLVGPGGVGKTRLAVEVALSEAARCPGGVWLAELAPVSEDGVMPALRTVLGGPVDAATGSELAAALGPQALLVVLDNCEHVLDAAARAAHELVTAAPQVRVLATSREALGVPGEVLFDVPPLESAAAVRLFAERAAAAAPGIRFDEPDTVAVGDICDRLDGLPLAIELAASRARALEVTQIAARLSDRFGLLTGGARTALPRQQTLRAVVDWSYDLLADDERLVFQRLSVFAGGTTLTAAEEVCAGDGVEVDDVADVVFRLVDKSLLTSTPGPADARYSMLQTLVEYARERLEAAGHAETYRGRHAAWVLALACGAERNAGVAPTLMLNDLDREVDNIDAALSWTSAHDPSTFSELAGRLAWFWFWTGRNDVGWRAVSTALKHSPEGATPSGLHARTLAWAGMLGAVLPEAVPLIEQAVAEARACGHRPSLGCVLGIRAAQTIVHGQPALALGDIEEADACYADSDDLHARGMISMVRGIAAMSDGRLADAESAYQRSIDYLREAGDEWAAGVVYQRMGEVAERKGDFDAAASALEAAVLRAADLPNRFAQALLQGQLASTRLGQGRLEEAAILADEAVGRAKGHFHAAVHPQANHIRGRIAMRRGQPEAAEGDLLLAMERYRSQRYHALEAMCLSDLGRVAGARQDMAGSLRLHAEALTVAGKTEDPMVKLSALEGLVLALAAAGQGERAGLTLGAADALRLAGAHPWDPNVDEGAAASNAVRGLVGEEALVRLRADGRTASIEGLVDGLFP